MIKFGPSDVVQNVYELKFEHLDENFLRHRPGTEACRHNGIYVQHTQHILTGLPMQGQ